MPEQVMRPNPRRKMMMMMMMMINTICNQNAFFFILKNVEHTVAGP